MRKRLIVGLTLAATLIALLLLDGYLSQVTLPVWLLPGLGLDLAPWLLHGAVSTAVVLVLTVLATHELVLLARARGYHPFGRTAQFFAAALVIGPYVSFNLSPLTGAYDESLGMFWMALAVGCMFLLQALLYRTRSAMEHPAITVFIIFYSGGLAGFMTKLRMEVGGATGLVLLLFSMFLVKMTDTGAYFIGAALGRHKMVPWLSPKKTWEGLAGGLAVTVLCAVGIGLWLHRVQWIRVTDPFLPMPWALAVLGLALGIASAAGDLCASLLKRDAAVKDSGRALPGLGGILDILDSPLLAAPIAWLFWTRVFNVVP